MAQFDVVMPKMGESIMEATIIRWLKQPGERIEKDETLLEIATDKVDSEVPSPVAGVVLATLFKDNDVVPVGTVIAQVDTAAVAGAAPSAPAAAPVAAPAPLAAAPVAAAPVAVATLPQTQQVLATAVLEAPAQGRFYSPLVLTIAREENIGMEELARIPGTGAEARVTKKDILQYVDAKRKNAGIVVPEPAPVVVQQVAAERIETAYVANGNGASAPVATAPVAVAAPVAPVAPAAAPAELKVNPGSITFSPEGTMPVGVAHKNFTFNGAYELQEMDRMRRMISENMSYSKQVSPHVTSFVEADVTNLVRWREKAKDEFEKKYGQKLTFTPLFVVAVARALRDMPNVNVSVAGDKIVLKKDINVAMAVALPSGNLIVPVIRNADQLNLAGLAKKVNDLSARARINKLTPDDLTDGTFTLSNVGTFGNVMGTPIIMQPQAAVLAVGVIRKKPAVLETPEGDVIAIRQMMFLSHSYDHRVIDGALGGSFVRRVADYLEAWDINHEV
jgi:2-oxoglutarate dehydrogenase E2 component (dihydrolipoamide succinyltransferase)